MTFYLMLRLSPGPAYTIRLIGIRRNTSRTHAGILPPEQRPPQVGTAWEPEGGTDLLVAYQVGHTLSARWCANVGIARKIFHYSIRSAE